MHNPLTGTTRTAMTIARELTRAIAALLRRGWQAHLHLLRTNPVYAAAVAAVAAAIAAQEDLLDLIAALAATVLAIYSATRRGVARA